jgi:hypothetical protein
MRIVSAASAAEITEIDWGKGPSTIGEWECELRKAIIRRIEIEKGAPPYGNPWAVYNALSELNADNDDVKVGADA